MTRAAIYARVSTADGRQETENQLFELRRFAASQGWHFVGEYIDEESGKSSDRQGFKRLFDGAARREFDLVLFWAFDRFSREGAFETLQHLNRLSGYGVGFRSFTEAYLDSCGVFRDAIITILGAIARQERQRLAERVRAGPKRAQLQGTRSGRAVGRPKAVFDHGLVLSLRQEGRSWREIAATMHLGEGTVRRPSPSTPARPSPAKTLLRKSCDCGTAASSNTVRDGDPITRNARKFPT